MRLPQTAAFVVAIALLASALPAPAAEQQSWPGCANFRNQNDARITFHADQSDPLNLAAHSPAKSAPCSGNVSFDTQPLISCTVLDSHPNARAALQLLYAYTRADGDPYGLDPDGDGVACDQSFHGQSATPESEDLFRAATPLPSTGNVKETSKNENTSVQDSSSDTTAPSGSRSGRRSALDAGAGTPVSLDSSADTGFGDSRADKASPVVSSAESGSSVGVPFRPASLSGANDIGTSGGATSDTGKSGSSGGNGGKSGSSSGTTSTNSGGTSGTGKQDSSKSDGAGKTGSGSGDAGAPATHGSNDHQHSARTPSQHARSHGKHHASNAKGSHHRHAGHHSNAKKNHHHGRHHKKH